MKPATATLPQMLSEGVILGDSSSIAEMGLPCIGPEGNRVVVERIGPYRVEAVLGQGGMGEVFLARDDKLQRPVAIKRIRGDLPVDRHQRARFRREAKAAARLCHPAIVQIFDLLETDGGDCLVMEWVEGKSLAERIGAGDLDLPLLLRLGGEIAEGLAEAHAKGLVHRDLKPANVLVTSAGHAKIVDFGLARMLWQDDDPGPAGSGSASALTEAGMLVGTLHAMSPEQAGGREVDHRSDLFALGSLLYEMAAGQAPFRGENWLDTLRRVHAEEPEPLSRLRPDLPADLVGLIEQLLSKNREARPANARLVAERLERIARGGPAAALLPPAPGLAAAAAEQATGEWRHPGPSGGRGEMVLRSLLRVERVAGHDLRGLRDRVAQHGGLEVEKGEALLALFERPVDAVACALAHQQALAHRQAPPAAGEAGGMAVHLGEVLLERSGPAAVGRGARPIEIEGPAKEVVARLGALAGPGQILLTRSAFDLARRAGGRGWSESRIRAAEAAPEGGLRWLAHGAYRIAGGEEPLEVFEVGEPGSAPLKAPADSPAARRLLSPSEERMLGWRPATGQPVPQRPHWLLLERLGEGGFGEVWLARHKAGERRVFKFCFEADRLRALKREVTLFRLLRDALGHRDDIARILDWQFEEAPYFVESEYTEGGNLPAWAEENGGLAEVPVATRLELAAELADALAAAHSVGILHKDVKPENVLVELGRDGRPHVRLTDFGVGQLTRPERLAEAGLTRLGFTETLGEAGAGQGTYLYLAPELLEGKAATIQADVFSLGVLVYQLAAGDFGRSLAPGWERDVGDALLAEDIAELVDGRPERRPASAREVAERLRSLEARRESRRAAAAREAALAKAQQRRRLASVLATVALVVLAIVTVMALREYRARQAAEASERRAALRQKQAEELIDFMLGDLRKKLDGVGRLDVLDAVGEQAMAYFAAVPAAELSDRELARRSKALYQIGEVRVNQGQLPAARTAFAEAVRLAGEIVARDPGNDQWAFELAQGRFWLGQVDWSQGRAQPARENFAGYLEIAAARAARDPASTRWQLESAYALTSLAAVEEAAGEATAAETRLRRAIAIKKALVEREPANREWQVSLANGLAWLGAMMTTRNRLAESVGAFEAEREIREALVEQDGRDAGARAALATCLGLLGQARLDVGDAGGAAGAFGRERALFAALAAGDPANRRWQRDLAVAILHEAEVLSFAGRKLPSRQQAARAEAALAALTQLDPSNGDWRIQLAAIRLKRAEIEIRGGSPRTAAWLGRQAFQALDREREAPTGRPRTLRAAAALVEGRALAELGQKAAARRIWEQAAAGFGEAGGASAESHDRHVWAEALLRLDRRQEALQEIARLRAAGYRRPDFTELCSEIDPD